jgi:hypothetical protein
MNITGLPVLWLLFASGSTKMQIFFFRFQFFEKSEQNGHIFCFISLQKPPFHFFAKNKKFFASYFFPVFASSLFACFG